MGVLDLEHYPDGGSEVIVAPAELDVYTSPAMRHTVRRLAENGRVRLVIDMTRCVFLDSTGLGTLIGALRVLGDLAGAALTLAGVGERQLRMLDVTGLARILPVAPTVAAALAGQEAA